MMPKRLVFSYFDDFKTLSRTLTYITHCIRNQSLWPEYSSAIPMISANYSRIAIKSISLKKWTLLTKIVFRYSGELQKLYQVLTFIAYHIRFQWLQGEFCSPILLITRNNPTHSDWYHIAQGINDSHESSV